MKALTVLVLTLVAALAHGHDCPHAVRDLTALTLETRTRFEAWRQAAELGGWRIEVSETRRNQERQDCLAVGGHSWVHHSNHQDGLAVDIFIVAADGSAVWDIAAYQRLYSAAPPQDHGLVDGGCLWGTDYDHLQVVEVQGSECTR